MPSEAEDVAALAAVGSGLNDDQLAAASRGLTALALRKIMHGLTHGSPQFQQSILRSFIPAIVKASSGSDVDEQLEAIKAQMMVMQQQMFESFGGVPDMPEEVGEAPVDGVTSDS